MIRSWKRLTNTWNKWKVIKHGATEQCWAIAYSRPVVVIYVDEFQKQQKIVIDKNASSVDEHKRNPICLGLLSSHNEANNQYVSLLPNPRSEQAALATDSTISSAAGNKAKAEVRKIPMQFFFPICTEFTDWCVQHTPMCLFTSTSCYVNNYEVRRQADKPFVTWPYHVIIMWPFCRPWWRGTFPPPDLKSMSSAIP